MSWNRVKQMWPLIVAGVMASACGGGGDTSPAPEPAPSPSPGPAPGPSPSPGPAPSGQSAFTRQGLMSCPGTAMTPADMNQLTCLIGSAQGFRVELGQQTNQRCQLEVTATTITVDGVSHVISDQAYADGSNTWSRYYTDLWNDPVYGAAAQLHLVSSDAATSSAATFEFFGGTNAVLATVVAGTSVRAGCQVTVR